MKSVVITQGFTGYPAGQKRHFSIGDEPVLADDYADLIIGKGLASEPAKTTPPAKAKSKD